MAPGYVIALALEAAGLAGVLLSLAVTRQERLARAEGLRGFLGTGVTETGGSYRLPVRPLRVVRVPVTPAPVRASAEVDCSARSALRRALLAA